MTSVVRIQEAEGGELTGTVERLRTGEKRPFRGTEALARLVEQAVRAGREQAARESGTSVRY